jgi:hypothetical protein
MHVHRLDNVALVPVRKYYSTLSQNHQKVPIYRRLGVDHSRHLSPWPALSTEPTFTQASRSYVTIPVIRQKKKKKKKKKPME